MQDVVRELEFRSNSSCWMQWLHNSLFFSNGSFTIHWLVTRKPGNLAIDTAPPVGHYKMPRSLASPPYLCKILTFFQGTLISVGKLHKWISPQWNETSWGITWTTATQTNTDTTFWHHETRMTPDKQATCQDRWLWGVAINTDGERWLVDTETGRSEDAKHTANLGDRRLMLGSWWAETQ